MAYLKEIFVMQASKVKHLVPLFFMLIFSRNAFALKVSDLTAGMRSETSEIVPVFLMIVAGLGVCFGSVAVISAIIAKKNNQPLSWQVFGVVGGALSVVIPIILLAAGGSMTGGEGDGSNMMNSLNIDY
ncbi:hypothetical protein LCGC14_0555560 [marine sediment metagenome]|uniref:Uncharacterized protein n=1 Tax=marine sediment metagenome TaxID=412755 RepID=A0A0F9RNE1_9ZZZZ